MSDVIARNQIVSDLMSDFFNHPLNSAPEDTSISHSLDVIFSSTSWGFREILLVIVIARIIDDTYNPSTSFYKCKPRALYEGPIRQMLLEKGIPHKKSGPLNVAKAAVGINEQWSEQRRPLQVAKEVVKLVHLIENMSKDELMVFGRELSRRFLSEAVRVSTLTVNIDPETEPAFLFKISKLLIEEVPDSGNTPQRIVGLLLQTHNEELQLGVKVSGHEDRASVTNTTSKKPGDITEELLDGTIIKVIEVTVKPFNQSRIQESYESVRAFDEINNTITEEIIVLCRRADFPGSAYDTNLSPLYFGKIEYQDLIYHFVDIYDWIFGQLLRMIPDSRTAFYMKLNEYISDPNTSEKLKLKWNQIHKIS